MQLLTHGPWKLNIFPVSTLLESRLCIKPKNTAVLIKSLSIGFLSLAPILSLGAYAQLNSTKVCLWHPALSTNWVLLLFRECDNHCRIKTEWFRVVYPEALWSGVDRMHGFGFVMYNYASCVMRWHSNWSLVRGPFLWTYSFRSCGHLKSTTVRRWISVQPENIS